MAVTLDTSHFEMSELNASASLNTAESKKEKRKRGTKRSSEKMRETNLWNFRAKKEEKGEKL